MFNADVRATSKVREFLFAFGDTVSGQQAISFLLARFYRFAADFECLLGVDFCLSKTDWTVNSMIGIAAT